MVLKSAFLCFHVRIQHYVVLKDHEVRILVRVTTKHQHKSNVVRNLTLVEHVPKVLINRWEVWLYPSIMLIGITNIYCFLPKYWVIIGYDYWVYWVLSTNQRAVFSVDSLDLKQSPH